MAAHGKRIKIFLADDHAVLRSGLTMLLNAEKDMIVVGEAADGRETIERAPKVAPDVVLLDISMPELSGLEVARRLRRSLPQTKVIVLTMHDDEGYLAQFLAAGCSGYVLKKSADTELIAAIRAVASGDTFVCPSMSKALVARYVSQHTTDTASAKPANVSTDSLTEREEQVLALVAQGYSNKEIADKLFLSVKTIETHKARIMEKLGFSRRAQLVRYAIETGLMQKPIS